VNQFCLRFETTEPHYLAQKDIIQLYSSLSNDFSISSLETLNMWAGKKGYSLAQGQ
jgi:isocitrate dehydrogenase